VIGRRVCISSVAGGLLGAPLAAAQPTGKVHRIGFLGVASPADTVFRRFFDAFRSGLAERGYVEGPLLYRA
jgi:hypothetical protein